MKEANIGGQCSEQDLETKICNQRDCPKTELHPKEKWRLRALPDQIEMVDSSKGNLRYFKYLVTDHTQFCYMNLPRQFEV